MSKIVVPHICFEAPEKPQIEAQFAKMESYPISCNNWQEAYPYAPKVSFKMFHNGKNLFLRFNVEEDNICAAIDEDFGEVWTDPCVEFFIAFDNEGYYNFECTCIGRLLVAYRQSRDNCVRLPKPLLNKIIRFPSLGEALFALRKETVAWSLIEVIPVEAMFHHSFTSYAGIKAKANFYKCGDNLPQPHFLSWSPIDTPTPNFHIPRCFGEIEFED